MANPQKENGYTPIANEILDKFISIPLNGSELRIILTIWRFTYGFSRKQHDLSEGFISRYTGIDRRQVRRYLSNLIKLNIISVLQESTASSPRNIEFNKNYDTWVVGVNLPPEGESTPTPEGESTPTPEGESTPTPGNESFLKTQLVFSLDGDSVGVGVNLPPEGESTPQENNIDLKTRSKSKSKTRGEKKIQKDVRTIEGVIKEFTRYDLDQRQKILRYWGVISKTRQTGNIANSVIEGSMNYWEKFSVNVVIDSIMLHMARYPERKENYTEGIMRGKAEEEKNGRKPNQDNQYNPGLFAAENQSSAGKFSQYNKVSRG